MGKASWTKADGPLAPFAAGFRQQLVVLGHPPTSAKHYLVLMGQLDRWLSSEAMCTRELSAPVARQFIEYLRARGQGRVPTLASFAPLLAYLRDLGVVAPEPVIPPAPIDELLSRYRRHLVDERGLAQTTVHRYETFSRRFLMERAERIGTPTGTEGLTSAEVNSFMLGAAGRLAIESAKREAADLRALLRFLYLDGILAIDLGAAMPPVACWRGTSLPPVTSAAEVDILLDASDRSSPAGRRYYAVLVLMARLGLRACEVAALRLGDVDWRAGEIEVRGKGGRRDRLPLPVEVGEALVDYLEHSRPTCDVPQLIVTRYAPFRAIRPGSLTSLVYKSCRRAELPRFGAHRLRHAFATEMLRRGGDLLEIAQVLRQSDLATTSGYAKVDRHALRTVAQPWPGVER
jgi:integrase/recombinase XerD